MPLEGLSGLLSNLDAQTQKQVQGRVLAGAEICHLLKSHAKQNAPFTDRTGNLRASIDADIEKVSVDSVTMILSAGMEYAPYVELRWEQRFAYLMPTIEANKDRMLEIVQRNCGA